MMHALARKGQGRSKRVAQAEIITVNESNRFLPLRDDEQSVFVCVFYFLCLNPEPCGQQIHSNWISKLSVPGIQHTCTLSCLRESESWNSNSLLFQKSRGILKTFRQFRAKVAGGGGGRQKKRFLERQKCRVDRNGGEWQKVNVCWWTHRNARIHIQI